MTSAVHLRAASHTSGFATVPLSEGLLRIVVLPKAWGAPAIRREVDWSQGDVPRDIVLFENEHLSISGLNDVDQNAMDNLLAACADAAEVGKTLNERESCLLLPAARRARDTAEPPPTDWVTALADLLKLHKHTTSGRVDRTARKRDPALSALTHLEFVTRTQRALRWLRRGYVPTQERVGSVRGAIVPAASASALLAGAPRLVCRFDRFTAHTMMLRVICTALDMVASTPTSPMLQSLHRALAPNDPPPQQTARALRRALADVPSLPLGVARPSAARVRPRPMDRAIWAPVLRGARDVLWLLGPDWQRHDQREGPRVWTLNTAAAWEQILAGSLERVAAVNKVRTQHTLRAPWAVKGLRPRHADLFVEVGDSRWLLDAKYSIRELPPADHLAQIYTYCRTDDAHPRHTGLIYTRFVSSSHGPRVQNQGPYAVHDAWSSMSPGTAPLQLHLVHADFPPRDQLDVANYTAWCLGLGRELARALGMTAPASVGRDSLHQAEPSTSPYTTKET